MPRGVYKRKRRKLPKSPDVKPAKETFNLTTELNYLINRLINLRDLINGKA